MGTIFGICQADGLTSDQELCARMVQVMDHWHADRRCILELGGVLLGNLRLFGCKGEDRVEAIQRLGPLSITADIRLDNREELLHALGIDQKRGEEMSDELVILQLYRRFSMDGLVRLIGDFAFAIYDSETRRLICMRDAMGVRPLYYSLIRNGILFSTEPRGILAHPDVDSSLDDDFILRLMAGLPPDSASTFRKGMRHLPPGHALSWSEEGLRIQRVRSINIPSQLRLSNRVEYQEAFREQLRKAVACRLPVGGPVGVELSGGLDSSAIAAFASKLLTDRDRLYSFTNVSPEGMAEAADEWPFASRIVEYCGIQNAIRISKSRWKHPFHAQDLHISDHCGVDLVSPFWLEPGWAEMQARGIRTCLSGFLGDEVATHPGTFHYYDFLEDGRFLDFFKACLVRGEFSRSFKGLVTALLPDRVLQILHKPKHEVAADPGYLLENHPMMHQRDAPMEGSRRVGFSHRRHLQQLAGGLYARRRMQNETLAAIRYRIQPSYPFADIRLIEFVLSLPPEMTGHPSIDRYLYRSSLAGIVPDSVRLRTDKHVPTGVFPVHELRIHASDIRAQAAEIGHLTGYNLATRLDFGRIDRDLDASVASNFWKGHFFPQVPFHILALVRYFDSRGGGQGLLDTVRAGAIPI